MRKKTITLLAFAALMTATFAAEGQGKSGMTARLEAKAIVVEGLKPQQEVLLFGVSLEPTNLYASLSKRWDKLAADDDGDGAARFELGSEIALRSVFAVVDLRSGDYVVLKPAGYDQLIPQELGRGAMRKGAKDDEVVSLELGGPMAHVVVVRGGAGAWGLSVNQNGLNDGDHNSPVMRVDPETLTRLAGNAPPPKVLTPGDVLFVINPIDMEFFFTRLTR